MKRLIAPGIAGISACVYPSLVQAQVSAEHFSAASVRPVSPAPSRRMQMSGGPDTSDATRIQYRSVSPLDLIGRAYDVPWYQISGPSWLGEAIFDVSAIMPEGSTQQNFRNMLRNLLAERFRMKARREVRTVPIYVLAQSKVGAKLKPAQLGADGTPRPPGNLMFVPIGPAIRLTGPSVTISTVISNLVRLLRRPVIDQTELTGLYSVDLRFQPESAGTEHGDAPGPDLPSLFTGIREQLGLELREGKGPVEMIVIESMDREPTEN